MNSYLVKRLSPIYIFYIGIELLELAVMFVLNRVDADLSFSSIVKTVGILILTSSVSFVYMMIPYVLYLLFLPRNKYGSNFDKIITTIYYTFLVYLVIFEEVASLVFWDEFFSAFNVIVVDYLIYTTEVVKNIQQSYPVAKWLLGIMAATFIIVLFSYRHLTAHTDIPKFPRRLFCTSIYILFGVLMYFNVDIANLEVGSNRVNNELAKDGVYSLFSAFFKNELYLSQLAAEGIYFSHVYANGTRSVRGIEAVMLSVPPLPGLLNFDYESRFYGKDIFNSNYHPRFFISNYQKIGYNENDKTIILKPIKQKSYLKEDKDDGSLLEKAVAYYQQSADLAKNLKQ